MIYPDIKLLICWSSLCFLAICDAQTPRVWLRSQGIPEWELAFDHDGDGFTTGEEYRAGTDPFDADSYLDLSIFKNDAEVMLQWNTGPGALYRLSESIDLTSFFPLGNPLEGDGASFRIDLVPENRRTFFSLQALPPLDPDGDTLSNIEEAILGTNPELPDTDQDARTDADEVFIFLSDPLVPDLPGGTIRGTVLTDPNNDGDLSDGSPVAGATIYLDRNFNGEFDEGDRTTTTDAAGHYEFTFVSVGIHHVRQLLPPPMIQTFPRPGTPKVVDGLPDEVVEYIHDNPDVPGFTGNLEVPYGKLANEDPSTWGGVSPKALPEPVDVDLVLKPIGVRNTRIGLGPRRGAEVLTIPKDGSITLRFDEAIIDGPGPDLTLHSFVAAADEFANLELGRTAEDLQFVERIAETGGVFLLDLADYDLAGPIHFLKVTALDDGGSWFGFEMTGVEVHNFARADASAHIVTITESEVFEDRDFGRFFDDIPPSLTIGYEDLNPETPELRSGEMVELQIFAEDDLEVSSLTARANGTLLSLDENQAAPFFLEGPGLLTVEATAIDSAGQETTRSLEVYVTESDGSDPFDPRVTGLGDATAPDAPRTRILSPGPGEVLSADTEIIANITGRPDATDWTVEYAPVDLVDPYDLNADDPDYIDLASGTGDVFSSSVGLLPVSGLADGVYFLRLCARNSPSRRACFGLVFAKNVAQEELRPQVTITSPADGEEVSMTADLTGTITSSRPLREWFVEYALTGEVDPNNIASDRPDWKRIAEGSATIDTPSVLATFDATLLKSNNYVVRIVARNNIGLGWAEPLSLAAVGDAKLGRNRVEFTDVEIDLAGFPVSFTRVYDSLQAEEDGELGYGWSLKLQDPDIRETVPDTAVSGPFGATPFREGTRVYITSPSGERLGFTFELENPRLAPGIGVAYQPVFEPDPGNYHTLEVPETGEFVITQKSDGSAYIFFINLPYNPSRYILTAPDGNRFTYHEDRGFLEARDPNGNTLTSTSNGIVHSAGIGLDFTRDPQGRIISMTDPENNTWQYGYDVDGNLASTTDPQANVTTYQYLTDPAHFLAGITDPLGRMPVRYEYDPDNGRLVAQIDGQGNRTEIAWDPSSFTGSQTSPRGFTTHLRYDARGNILEETDPGGNVTTYLYEDPVNPDKETSVTDPNGNTWTFAYNSMGLPTRIRPPDSPPNTRIDREYDRFGNVTRAREISGAVSTFEYDEQGNLSKQTPAHANEVEIIRTPEGAPTEVILNDRYSTHYDLSESGQLAGVSDTFGYDVEIESDKRGRTTKVIDGDGRSSEFTFDHAGIPTSQKDFKGNVVETEETSYSEFLTTGPLGTSSCVVLDENGRPVESTIRSGGTITPSYDASGNLASLTDALGNTTRYSYDFADRLLTTTCPNGHVENNVYDGAGLLVSTTTRSGKKRSFTYDPLGRLRTESWHAPDDTIIRTLTFSYRHTGFLEEVIDRSGEEAHAISFDGSFEQPNRETVTYANQVECRINYRWDDNGVRHTSPATATFLMDRTTHNSLRAEYQGNRCYRLFWSASPAGSARLENQYFPNGALKKQSRFIDGTGARNPVDLVTTFSYDANGPISAIRHEDLEGDLIDPRAAFTYGFDAADRITSIIDGENTASVSYDNANRLVAVANSAPGREDEAYRYDLMGNRLDSHFTPSSHSISTGNLLTANGLFAYTYDLDGNLASRTSSSTGEVTTFSYDHRNRLNQILVKPDAGSPASTTIRLDYDFRDRLICREVNGEKTWIVNDREMPIGEFRDGESSPSALFCYSLDRVDDFHAVWRVDSGESWFLKDHLGSIRGITDGDGTLVSWQNYDSFGRVLGTPVPEPLAFAGRFRLAEVDLYENRRRFYDPTQGRFLSEDPLGYSGGDLNFYTYVRNLPLMLTDPLGQSPVIGYGMLVDLITFYVGALCNFGNCVGTLYAGVVKGFIEKSPMANLPLNECVLPLLPVDPCKLNSDKNLGQGNNFIGYAAAGSGSSGAGLLSQGLSVAYTVKGCSEITFEVTPVTCGGSGGGNQ